MLLRKRKQRLAVAFHTMRQLETDYANIHFNFLKAQHEQVSDLSKLLFNWRELADEYEQVALHEYLKSHSIAKADIIFLNDQTIQMLATRNVITADDFDITEAKQISELSRLQYSALVSWHENLLLEFSRREPGMLHLNVPLDILYKLSKRKNVLMTDVVSQYAELEKFKNICERKVLSYLFELGTAVVKWQITLVNAQAIGVNISIYQ